MNEKKDWIPPFPDPASQKATNKQNSASPQASSQKQPSKTKAPPRTPAQILFESVKANQLFKDSTGKGYVEFTIGQETYFCEPTTQQFSAFLNKYYYDETKNTTTDAITSSVCRLLQSEAILNGLLVTVGRRFMDIGSAVYIDLANSRNEAVEIDSNGWRLSSNSSIKFVKYPGIKPLPTPFMIKNGDAARLFRFINSPDPVNQLLILAFLTSLPRVGEEHPILNLIGSTGSGKTTAAKMIKMLVDPATPLITNCKLVDNEMAAVLSQTPIPAFDNISNLSQQQSDMFCRIITGTDYSARSLYTNFGTSSVSFQCPIILTALRPVSQKADFISRSIYVNLNKLTDDTGENKRELENDFINEMPVIFAGLLDLMSSAMKVLPSIKKKKHERLGNFADWGAAVASVLGVKPDTFFELLRSNASEQAEDAPTNDPVADAIISHVQTHGEYSGLTSELYTNLTRPPNSVWPGNSAAFGKRLIDAKAILEDIGYEVVLKPVSSGKHVSIKLPTSDSSVGTKQEFVERNIRLIFPGHDVHPELSDNSSESLDNSSEVVVPGKIEGQETEIGSPLDLAEKEFPGLLEKYSNNEQKQYPFKLYGDALDDYKKYSPEHAIDEPVEAHEKAISEYLTREYKNMLENETDNADLCFSTGHDELDGTNQIEVINNINFTDDRSSAGNNGCFNCNNLGGMPPNPWKCKNNLIESMTFELMHKYNDCSSWETKIFEI